MKKQSNITFQKICVFAGVCLLVGAISALILWQWNINVSEARAQSYVDTLRTFMPKPENAVPEERRDNTMPSLPVEGTDFVGIIEMPRFESALPVCAAWGESSKYPCRFSGSVYNGTLQIGATTQKGQYDFYREISVGDKVYLTDMEGNRYTFEITDLRYEAHANQAALQRKGASLTLFIKNIYAFEYLIVFCNVT